MLTVTGIDLRDMNLIKKYAYFCLSRFVSNANLKRTIIIIRFVTPDELTNKKECKELKEISAWLTYDGLVGERKKFTITLNKKAINKTTKKQITRYKNSLKDLGHELIHAKQYINNEIFDYIDGQRSRFMGRLHTYTGELDWSYWESPWEIEAYGRMEGLYQMFLKLLKEEEKA